jgi:hypothetical protein
METSDLRGTLRTEPHRSEFLATITRQ